MTTPRRTLSSVLSTVVPAALLCALLVGCSGDAADSTASSGAAASAPEVAQDGGTTGGLGGTGGGTAGSSEAVAVVDTEVLARTDRARTQLAGGAVVRTAELSVHVDDVRAAADAAGRLVRAAGGELAAERTDAQRGAELTLRVPPERFDELLDRLAGLGEQAGRVVSTDEVGDQLVDLESRLSTQRASVARVQALLAEATDLGEVVQIEAELTRRTADLESLQARLAALQDQVDSSTILLRLAEPEGAGPGPTGFVDGLQAGRDALLATLAVLATVTGAVLPFLPLALVGWLVVRARRRRPAAQGPLPPRVRAVAGRGVRGLVLVATSLAAFTATLDNTVVAVAVVDLQADLGAGVSELQGVVTAYTVALAALLLTGGTLADVAGRRRVLLAGLAVFAAASAACALSTTAGALVAARAVQGAGAALVLPGALAVLAAAFPEPAARARAVGVWAATGAAALVLGPVVGGLLVARSGWPAVFWVNLPLCALVALVLVVAPAGDPPERGRRLDLPGQLLAAVGLAAATYAVVLAGRDGLGGPVLLAGGVGVVALAAFGVVERRSADPMLPLSLLRERAFLGAMTGAFAASLAVFVLLVFLSLFLQLVQLREPLPTALRLLPLTAGLVLVAPLAGRWAARRGPRVPATLGLAASGLALGVLALRLREDLGDGELAAVLALSGAGLGLATAPVVAASLDAVARTRSGLAAAGVNVARELGGVVAVAGLGALAVARLSSDLTSRLRGLGVPGGRLETVVDALLRGAGQREVVGLSGGEVPLDALLLLRGAAEDSYVGSVRLVLLGAAVVLLLSALVATRTLEGSPARAAAA